MFLKLFPQDAFTTHSFQLDSNVSHVATVGEKKLFLFAKIRGDNDIDQNEITEHTGHAHTS